MKVTNMFSINILHLKSQSLCSYVNISFELLTTYKNIFCTWFLHTHILYKRFKSISFSRLFSEPLNTEEEKIIDYYPFMCITQDTSAIYKKKTLRVQIMIIMLCI